MLGCRGGFLYWEFESLISSLEKLMDLVFSMVLELLFSFDIFLLFLTDCFVESFNWWVILELILSKGDFSLGFSFDLDTFLFDTKFFFFFNVFVFLIDSSCWVPDEVFSL